MNAYVAIAVSILTLLYTIWANSKNDTKSNATELTTVIVKLETINTGIRDIKAEIAALRSDQKTDHDKLIRLESSISSAWTSINELKENANL